MKAWFRKVFCWIDDHAHMALWFLSGAAEGFDLTPFASSLTDFIGQKGVSAIVLTLAALGMWRARVTRARGRALKAEVADLRQQVEQTVVPEK